MTRIGRPAARWRGSTPIVEADSHPDWRLDPKSALGPSTARKGGDLARLLGVEDNVTEQSENLTLPSGTRKLLDFGPFRRLRGDVEAAWPHDHDHRGFVYRGLL